MTEFKTQVDLDLDLDMGGRNYDLDTKKMNLRWELELEMRQYGIKDFIITVPEQKVTVVLNIWGDEDDTQEEITLDIKDVKISRGDLGFEGLVPHTLEFYKGKWKLVFA